MATAKDCHALTSYYEKKYKERFPNDTPHINRYAARWGFDSVLGGMGVQQAKDLLDYYFTTPPTKRYDLDWFFYNYEKVWKAMNNSRDDAARRKTLMQESKDRAEKWRQSGKQSITDN